MTGKRPTVAMVLSAIGGLFILMEGIALIYTGSFLSALFGGLLPGPLGGTPVAILTTLGIIGVALGIGVMALGVVMFIKPKLSKKLGILVVLLSVASIAFGGFFLGLILGAVGGILGLRYKAQPPEMEPPMAFAP